MIESIAKTLNGRLLPRPACLLEGEGGQVALLVGSGVVDCPTQLTLVTWICQFVFHDKYQ